MLIAYLGVMVLIGITLYLLVYGGFKEAMLSVVLTFFAAIYLLIKLVDAN
ncbi:hypothetical protein [Oligella urethralis]|uniref:Uncharacterized protein n=1 Tax=Oligella urethralis TaxID=90245 RepID=A0A2X1UML3_9BURK|nr:hypothetical protein [Oligella urethralis]SPY08412.1 Uncharacterised protein [Oligella urethralis]